MRTNKTQKDTIKEHLLSKHFIEPLEALRKYGVYRLSAIIFKLKEEGLSIKTEYTLGISKKTGRNTKYAKYILNTI